MVVALCDTMTDFPALMAAVDLVSLGEIQKQSAAIAPATIVAMPITFR